jgi:phosphate-selective porin OprO/OprP
MRMRAHTRTLVTAASLTALFPASNAAAQSTESAREPIGTATGDAPPPAAAAGAYLLPDIVPPVAKPVAAPGLIDAHLGFVVLGDYTGIWQDRANIAQVGVQDNAWELRAARLSLFGSIGGSYRVAFQASAEYKGFDGDPDTTWQLTDLSLTFPLGTRTKLTLGKTKETFSYEMVAVAATLPQSERVLSPFFVSRNTGARITYVWGPSKQGTLSMGVYNDAWDIGAASRRGVDASARMTALLWAPDDRHFLHFGVSARHTASNGDLRYRGRPGSNVTDNFIDTGNFAADGALSLGLEGLLAVGGVSLQGEYVATAVDAPTVGNPHFSGWYVGGSWFPLGDTRPYDRNVGYTRAVVPKSHWGAPELVVRYADVDLDDSHAPTVSGGRFRRTDVGANWWATTRWKAGVAWGRVWLDRGGTRGVADTLLTRIQYMY